MILHEYHVGDGSFRRGRRNHHGDQFSDIQAGPDGPSAAGCGEQHGMAGRCTFCLCSQ